MWSYLGSLHCSRTYLGGLWKQVCFSAAGLMMDFWSESWALRLKPFVHLSSKRWVWHCVYELLPTFCEPVNDGFLELTGYSVQCAIRPQKSRRKVSKAHAMMQSCKRTSPERICSVSADCKLDEDLKGDRRPRNLRKVYSRSRTQILPIWFQIRDSALKVKLARDQTGPKARELRLLRVPWILSHR